MSIKVTGIGSVISQLKLVEKAVKERVDEVTHKRALLMVNDTRNAAPRKTGRLANSINIITQESKPMKRVYGTNVEYALEQEYEHRTKRGFFRNTVMAHKQPFIVDVQNAVTSIVR